MSVLSKLLVLVTESLLALAASPAAPLAASTPALAAMPLLLAVDGEGRYRLLQGHLLSRVVSSSSVAGWTAATTVFLEFLVSQMMSANLAGSLTSS